jgi:hypothetical protein
MQPNPAPEMQTDLSIVVSPVRELDLVVMIDNSPSMGPKQTKLKEQFPNLINALKDTDGTLPNLRIAIIDSDLGTGGEDQTSGGNCSQRTASQRYPGSIWGDMGHFQMINATTCGVNSADDLFLEYKDGKPQNFDPTILGSNKNISDVFACLAGGLGTLGCGEEHSLQAFEFALVYDIDGTGEQKAKFLRSSAYLGLVFLSDEDDCSAATNESMFRDNITGLSNESPSLRCATRAHKCGGQKLSDAPPGYPTTDRYSHAFSDCVARVDTSDTDPDRCANQTDGDTNNTDTSVPTTCNPLKSIRKLADEIKSLKSDPNQILVAGIFGWPLSDPNAAPNDTTVFDKNYAAAEYKIDKTPNQNQNTGHPTVYDYWPVCYDPNHMPATATTDSDTGFDSTAAGFGATGGLRHAAFINQFGDNGMKFSICQTDFSAAMKQIGDALAKKLSNLCVKYKLMDSDLTTPGLQPDCRVVYNRIVTNSDGTTRYQEDTASLPECDATKNYSDTNLPPADCWMLTTNWTKCEDYGQLIKVLRTQDEVDQGQLAAGTKIDMSCLTCTDDVPNLDQQSDAYKRCHY